MRHGYSRLLPALISSLSLTTWLAPPAAAVPFDNHPKLLLHVRPATAKNVCTTWGTLADCRDATTEADLSTAGAGPYRFVYLLAARGGMPDVAAIQVGLMYQDNCPGNVQDQQRIDIFSWTLCASLEFVTPGADQWPRPGGGNLITWDSVNRCQTGEVAVAGYFYMACYGTDDQLRLMPRPVDGLAKVVECSSQEWTLSDQDLGRVAFSAGGMVAGCNPCDGPCPAGPVPPACTPVDLTPPAAVTNLTPISIGSESVTLRWTAPGDDGNLGTATSYDMRYSTVPITAAGFDYLPTIPGEPAPAPAGTLQSMTIAGLLPATPYYFALRATDDQRNVSGLSNVATATTQAGGPGDVTPPAAVTDLTIIGVGSTALALRWTAPGDDGSTTGTAAQYDMRYSTAAISSANFDQAIPVTGEPAPAAAGMLQIHDLSGLMPGTLYYVALKTADEAGNWSGLSNVPFARTDTPPPPSGSPALLLHVGPVVGAGACAGGWLEDCGQAVTRGDIAHGNVVPFYFVYLLAAGFSDLAGLQCGINYENGAPAGMDNHMGIDVFDWQVCATLSFPSPGWPAPMSGNLITWDSITRCQTGGTAVAGYFYVGAYSDDEMRVIPRPVDGLAKLADCRSAETTIMPAGLGTARFSDGGGLAGFNPCRSAVPVVPVTWGGVKTLIE